MEKIEPVRIRQKTIVQQVMEQIKELVASGNIKPGDNVPTEAEMARIFGVSRSSIREAIKIFAYLGVFDTQPRRGTILCNHSSISHEALTWTFLLGSKEIGDLMELRKAIEQECWLLLCENCSTDSARVDQVTRELGEEIEAMSAAREAKLDVELMEADFRFHQRVIDYSGNVQYMHLFQTLKSFTCETIRKSNVSRNFSEDVVEEHRQILKALRDRDESLVIQLFRTHIENSKMRVLSLNVQQ
jgi:GntR family transcriptional repressor for pyruvate dehydrogenase complex